MATDCLKRLELTNLSRSDANDLTTQFTMRYRLASDPDVDSSYTVVTTTRTNGGVIYYYFDTNSIDEGIYVIHTYANSLGSTTGEKMTVTVSCIDAPLT